ncbi:MAG: hypothetical protein C4320_00295 [Armatimonadota bacterium]
MCPVIFPDFPPIPRGISTWERFSTLQEVNMELVSGPSSECALVAPESLEAIGVKGDRVHDTPSTVALPVLVSRDSFVFPGLIGTLNVRRLASRAALDAAVNRDRRLLLIVQRDPELDNPIEADLYAYGTVCEVMHRNPLPDGSLRIVLRGIGRAWVRSLSTRDGSLWTEPEPVTEFDPEGPATEAARRLLVDLFAALVTRDSRIPEEALDVVEKATSLGAATDAVAHHLPLEASGRQATLEERNPLCRAEWLIGAIARENEIRSGAAPKPASPTSSAT